MEDVKVKPDPETAESPSGFEEEDIYEDAGDLEFNTNSDYQKLYLARVPKYIWEAWDKLDDDAEIRLGTIRTQLDEHGQVCRSCLLEGFLLTDQTQMSMLLTRDLAAHQTIPKEYDLSVSAERVDNTFVFTEKDLPGFKSRSRMKFDLASANMPSRLTRPKNDKPTGISKQPYDPNKKFKPYFRKAIPSQYFYLDIST